MSKLAGDVIGESDIHLGILGSAFSLVVLFVQQISFGLQSPERLVPKYVFIKVLVVRLHEQDGAQLVH